jgi:hypothetical protein
MTGYGPDGVDSLRSRRLTRVIDLSGTPPMCNAAGDVTFPPTTNGYIARVDLMRSRRFRVNSGGIHPACPDEGKERNRKGSLPRPSPVSNRELDLLEPDLSHCKQRAATVSNRELSTVRNFAFLSALGHDHLAVSLHGPRIAVRGTRRPTTFLTGSASQTETAITHSKQTLASFLTGSRIARMRFGAQQVQR